MSPTHDLDEHQDLIASDTDYESAPEMKFETEMDSERETKNTQNNVNRSGKRKAVRVRKRRSWEFTPQEKAEALKDIRTACHICTKESRFKNQSNEIPIPNSRLDVNFLLIADFCAPNRIHPIWLIGNKINSKKYFLSILESNMTSKMNFISKKNISKI